MKIIYYLKMFGACLRAIKLLVLCTLRDGNWVIIEESPKSQNIVLWAENIWFVETFIEVSDVMGLLHMVRFHVNKTGEAAQADEE